ncbi:MAG: hypothetical protein E5299_00135 [Burkholderia gladioli]|nr:MAG: hypothetical protein E5299_00135 [Burkholderia gladioli]
MYRFKSLTGDYLWARHIDSQRRPSSPFASE